jgi:hypothetical protein
VSFANQVFVGACTARKNPFVVEQPAKNVSSENLRQLHCDAPCPSYRLFAVRTLRRFRRLSPFSNGKMWLLCGSLKWPILLAKRSSLMELPYRTLTSEHDSDPMVWRP